MLLKRVLQIVKIDRNDRILSDKQNEFLVETDKFKRIEGYDISHFGGRASRSNGFV